LWKAGLITAGVALVIGLILTRQITRPVKALITGARRIAKGELNYRVKTRSNDEIGELADSFNSMAATLEQAEQSRRQLSADIAHELRTPLTIIEGTVEGMLDGVFEADSEHLNSIKEQALLLTHLINDLRDISLAESGQLNLNHQPTDIVGLVKKVVSSYEPNAGEKNIRIDISTSVPSFDVEIDPVRIEQVISNLLRNAIRHTPAGGSVTVTIDRVNNSLELSVSDTGEGIEAEDLPHVFERFYRSDTSRSRKEGGTGLGLAIVKQMVEAHGGSVSVESTPGKGSTFMISLPLPRE
ncbi:MAG: HAMP domain-containing protein, partial [Dehalococcoidales bacterium]